MIITKPTVAKQIAAYLHPEITRDQLVGWAENTLMDAVLAQVVSRLGVADARAFGLAWADCEARLDPLGFVPRVKLVAA
jgi:1,6-anhydro-N-acetylmuramate kinase